MRPGQAADEVVRQTHQAGTSPQYPGAAAAAGASDAVQAVAHLGNAAAHEINNPLTVVIVGLHLILDSLPPDAPARRWAHLALSASDRIHEVVDQMQRIDRLEYLASDGRFPAMLDIARSAPLVAGASPPFADTGAV